MINRNGSRASKPSFVPKFSDADVLKALASSVFWGHVFLGERKAAWLLFKALLFLKMEMFVSPLRMCLRHGHGRRTTGVFITFMSCTMMMAFNAGAASGALATFLPFIAPVLPFVMGGGELWDALFIDVRSPCLTVFWMVYLLLSIVHLVRANRCARLPPAHRGSSVLHTLLFRWMGVPEPVVQRFIEPLLTGAAGHVLMATGADTAFGLFLLIAAANLLAQEVFDAAMKFSISL